MSHDYPDVATTEPDRFGKLGMSDRAWLRQRRLREAEWASRTLPAGGLIAQLRQRARIAAWRGILMLAVLVVVGLLGASYLVAEATGFIASGDTEAEATALVVDRERDRIAELQRRQAELETALGAALSPHMPELRSTLQKFAPACPLGDEMHGHLDGYDDGFYVHCHEASVSFNWGYGESGERAEDDPSTGFPELDGFPDDVRERISALAEGFGNDVLLRNISRENGRLDRQINEARTTIEHLQTGQVQRDRQVTALQNFLDGCAGATPDRSADLVAACDAAYRAAVSGDSADSWYRYVAERLTPAALVLFLLVTLWAGSRYNQRLAALYDGRADALELAALELDETAYEVLVEALAGEKLEFRSSRTPVDAVTDITKEVISKFGVRKA